LTITLIITLFALSIATRVRLTKRRKNPYTAYRNCTDEAEKTLHQIWLYPLIAFVVLSPGVVSILLSLFSSFEIIDYISGTLNPLWGYFSCFFFFFFNIIISSSFFHSAFSMPLLFASIPTS
jgi:hypothetical protein